jgi:hypothetical protein
LIKSPPRLRGAVPKTVQAFGGEDPEELVQDAIVIAAQMLHSVEAAGRSVTPSNIAYYAVLHLKAGRRSQSGSRADVMAPATQLDRRSSLSSMQEEIAYDPELDESVSLENMLCSKGEDPATMGGRNLDWDGFIRGHDYRYGLLLRGMAEGRTLRDSAERCGETEWSIYHL